MSKYLLHPKLAHLNEEQVMTILDLYYKGEKIPKILERFNIDWSHQAFARHLPITVLDSTTCPNCGAPLVSKPPTRPISSGSMPRIFCSQCQHVDKPDCCCAFCLGERRRAKMVTIESRQSMIQELCVVGSVVSDKKIASDLSLHEAVGLLALTRTSELIDDGIYGPIADNHVVPFAPQGKWNDELLMNLWNSGLLQISDSTDFDAFIFDDEELNHVDLHQAHWGIICENSEALIQDIERCGLLGQLPESWLADLDKFRLDLALAECMEFYAYCLEERNFPCVIGPQTEAMLLNLLRDYSVSQCYRIIWKGAQQASDFKQRNNANSRHAANSMVGACQRFADYARVERWEISGFRRNYDRPRSMVNYVLYDVLLKIGDKGFTEIVPYQH